MKRFLATFAILILLGVFAATAQADVTIETVLVGNPGNTADDTGFGAVDYTYNIGKYEVTAGQYCEFLNAVAKTDTYGLFTGYGSYGCRINRTGTSGNFQYLVDVNGDGIEDVDWVNRPVNYVNWGDVARFCNWLHNGQGNGSTEKGAYNLSGTHQYYNSDGSINDKDGLNAALMDVSRETDWRWAIPSEDEWYKAAYHKNDGNSDYFDYPTNTNNMPSNELVDPDPGNNANFRSGGNHTIGNPYYTTPVGEFENSESPYGTFDQGGNLFEWNSAEVTGLLRGIRGGYYQSYFNDLAVSSYYYGTSPTNKYYSIGFRVVQVPEPGSIALLLCGLASVALIRRR